MELDPIKLEQLREKIHSDILKQIWGVPLTPPQLPQSAIEENEPEDADDECIQ